jgi:hypothetical protein
MLLLVLPGFDQMSVGCAMLIGRLLQEEMDRALAGKGLLFPESPEFQASVAALQKTTAARLKELKAAKMKTPTPAAPPALSAESVNGLDASTRFIQDVAERMYGGSLISFVRDGDRIYFGFSVSDLEAGLPVVEAELKRLGFLELAEIGHYDSLDNVCRTYHPKGPAAPAMSHCADVLRSAGLVPLW